MPSIPSRKVLASSSPRSFAEEYEAVRYLSSGSFADVWVCREKASGEEFACKVLQKSRITTDAQRQEVRREVRVMSSLQGQGEVGNDPPTHPGVVGLREVMESDTEIQLVMEMCQGGDLYNLLVTHGPLPEDSARIVFRQVASALAHCHSQGVVHRDLKPENILFDRSALGLYSSANAGLPGVQAKLADFGLSVLLGKDKPSTTGCAGSLYYVAPEMLRQLAYDSKVDMWSLGVTLCALLTARLPFSGPGGDEDKEGLVQSILRGQVDWQMPYWRHVSPAAKSLVLLLLEQDPVQRPSADEVLAHPWLAQESWASGRRSKNQLGRPRPKAFTAPLAPRPDQVHRLRSRQATRLSNLTAPVACKCDGENRASTAAEPSCHDNQTESSKQSSRGQHKACPPSDAARSESNKENWRGGGSRVPHMRKLRDACQGKGRGRLGLAEVGDCDCQLLRGVTPQSRRIGNLILKSVQAY